MSTTIAYIVRHGETAHNVLKIIQGHIDTPLNEEGEAQAVVLARFLRGKEIKFSKAYSSDLVRAKKTAETVLEFQEEPVCELILDERIRERHLGEFQGKRWGDADADKSTIEESSVFDSRLLSFWDSIFPSTPSLSLTSTSPTGNILIASHGGSIRALIAALLRRKEYNLDLSGEEEIVKLGNARKVDNCSITKIVMSHVESRTGVSTLKGVITEYASTEHFQDSSRAPSRSSENVDVVE